MARTIFPAEVDWKEYRELIENRARTYSRRTGKEVEDLIQEGHLTFLESLKSWDSENGCPFRAYLLNQISISFKKTHPILKRDRPIEVSIPMDECLPSRSPNPERETMFRCAFQKMSEPAQASCLFSLSPVGGSTKEVKRRVREQMREKGYSWPVIWDSIREVKSTLAQL